MLRSVSWALFVIILLLAMLTCLQSEKAYARANLTTYLTIQPNSWEMGGYNVRGTAANVTVNTIGWNATRLIGNVGIGDGSVHDLNQSSNKHVNYSENNFMAGDVSEAPWDPGRINRLDVSTLPGDKNDTTKSIESEADHMDSGSSDTKEKTVENENNTSQNEPVSNMGSTALHDIYHPILMGRPTDDLLYENPLTISGTAYGRLVGLRMPGGGCLNVGMRTLGYGY